MNRILDFMKTIPAHTDFITIRDRVAVFWHETTGLPIDDDIVNIVIDEVNRRHGEPLPERPLPIVFSHDEAVAIARKLGVTENAENLKTEIMETITETWWHYDKE